MPTGRWRMPYVSESSRAITGFFWFCAAMAGLLLVCGAAAAATEPTGLALVFGCVALWETLVWRVVGVGLYVGERGVKVRSVLRTRVLSWPSVERAWAGWATGFDAWAIWLTTTEPAMEVETPIWRKGSRARHRNRAKLDAETFAGLLDQLNAEAARHRAEQPDSGRAP